MRRAPIIHLRIRPWDGKNHAASPPRPSITPFSAAALLSAAARWGEAPIDSRSERERRGIPVFSPAVDEAVADLGDTHPPPLDAPAAIAPLDRDPPFGEDDRAVDGDVRELEGDRP